MGNKIADYITDQNVNITGKRMPSPLLVNKLVGIVLTVLCAGFCVSVPMNNPKQGELHHRIFNHSYAGPEQWKVVSEIDGLKNEEVAMFLLGTGAKEYVYMRERIIPSSRTWMRLLKNVFVVVEDTFDVRFAMRHCKAMETEHYTSFECHHEPTYILSRKCTSEYYGAAGPCCKVDDAINYLVQDRPDVYEQLKYFLHCDDDTFWRVDQVMRWLAAIENSGISSFPIVANPKPADLRKDPEHVVRYDSLHLLIYVFVSLYINIHKLYVEFVGCAIPTNDFIRCLFSRFLFVFLLFVFFICTV